MNDMLNHLAVIPDGNRRWAKRQGLKPWQGHKEGVERFFEIAETAFQSGVNFFTFWAASESNLLNRKKIEVNFLVKILLHTLKSERLKENLKKNKIRFKVLGSWNKILNNKALANELGELEEISRNFGKKQLTILFGYDGQSEMIFAIEYLRKRNLPANKYNIKLGLYDSSLPEVDLVVRTGGEPHWSAGFMMWLTANSQLFFTEKLWPDFFPADLHTAIADFKKRERRFGG